MPELPEVESAARILAAAARGKSITSLRILHPALARRLPNGQLERVRGLVVDRVERRGKHQLLHLGDGSILHVHFRMTGDWLVGRCGAADAPFARAALELVDGTRISLIDPRALATITWHAPGSAPLPTLGPEPTDPAFTATFLRDVLATRHGAIKPALLDQRVVAGLGNIYAAEALWLARISPRARATNLSAVRRTRLVRAIQQVLTRASRRAGRYADGATIRFNVYDREGECCRRCGRRIVRITQVGRSTYYCPRCQRA